MRKYLIGIVVLLTAMSVIVGLQGCGDRNVTNLAAQIALLKRECPMWVESGMVLTSADYDADNNTVYMYYSMPEGMIDDVYMPENHDAFKAILLVCLKSTELNDEFDDIVNAKASLVTVVENPTKTKKASFEISNDELKKLAPGTMTENEKNLEVIKNTVKMLNNSCPVEVEPGVEMTKIEFKDNCLEYAFRIVESQYDFNVLKAKKDEFLKNVVSERKELPVGSDEHTTLDAIVINKIGMRYTYTDSKSGKSFSFEITPQELADAMN